MDREFNTTFIPKKTIVKERYSQKKQKYSLLRFLAILLFITALLSSLIIFLFNQYKIKNIENMKRSLERSEKIFEPNAILDLKKLSIRLLAAEDIINNHLSLSSFFDALEQTTLEDISFSDFNFSKDKGELIVTMNGEGKRYTPIASQSLLFSENKFIQNHIFSNFQLTKKGTVSFVLEFTVNKDKILYLNLFEQAKETLSEKEEFLLENNIIE